MSLFAALWGLARGAFVGFLAGGVILLGFYETCPAGAMFAAAVAFVVTTMVIAGTLEHRDAFKEFRQ